MTMEEKLPHVIFKVKDNLYAINSRVTIALTKLPENLTGTQKSEKFELGIMNLRNQIVPVISMRMLFGCKTVTEEYKEFTDMIDARKNDHINWINELKKSVRENREFTLTTNPHQCEFGKWYDNFKIDIQNINFHMKKIDLPHTQLHQIALEVEKVKKESNEETREEKLEKLLYKAEYEYMASVIELLDRTKEIFKENFNAMVIVINKNNRFIGLLVDEIITVEDFIINETSEINFSINQPNFISAIGRTKEIDDHIFLVEDEKLFNLYKK